MSDRLWNESTARRTLDVDARDEASGRLDEVVHESVERHREPVVVRVVAIEREAVDEDGVERVGKEHPVMDPEHLDLVGEEEVAGVGEDHRKEREVAPVHRDVENLVGAPVVIRGVKHHQEDEGRYVTGLQQVCGAQ